MLLYVDCFFDASHNLRPYMDNLVYWFLQSDFFLPSQTSTLFTFFSSLCILMIKVQTLLTAVPYFRLFTQPKLFLSPLLPGTPLQGLLS